MGKPVNGYTVNAKKEGAGRQGWHFEIHKGDELEEKSDPEFRDYAQAMKAGTLRATELDPPE